MAQPRRRRPTRTHADFEVGWIAALSCEYVAACGMLDDEYAPLPPVASNDNNVYTMGRMSGHDVVIATLPKGRYGLASAATVARDMARSYPSLRIGLLVGVAGGAPTTQNQIRLGDVVVGVPDRRSGGVVHYTRGRSVQTNHQHGDGDGSFERTGSLNPPPQLLLTAVQHLSALHERRGHHILQTIQEMVDRWPRLQAYQAPPRSTDVLYKPQVVHGQQHHKFKPGQLLEGGPCCGTASEDVVQRKRHNEYEHEADDPVVHYGLIGSADQVLRNARLRDELAAAEGLLCFEMEASGLLAGGNDDLPCLVIRGICDYADSHKNKQWQPYAAATAAAYAKELLAVVPVRPGRDELPTAVAAAPQAGLAHGTGNADAGQTHTFTFTNYGHVQNQTAQQTINGEVHFH